MLYTSGALVSSINIYLHNCQDQNAYKHAGYHVVVSSLLRYWKAELSTLDNTTTAHTIDNELDRNTCFGKGGKPGPAEWAR